MSGLYEHDEIALAVDDGSQAVSPKDRMDPSSAGGAVGVLAGAAALGVVHAIAPSALVEPVGRAAAQWQVSPEISLAVAYVTAAAVGGLVGVCFASVTRYLRRWFPLLIWALVFFVSLTLLVLAFAKVPEGMAPSVLAASAAYGFVMSLSLPLRKRA